MKNKFVAGQVFEDNWGDEVARIVFADGVWSSDEDQATYLEENGELPGEDVTVIMYEFMYQDEYVDGERSISEFIRENGMINVAEREQKDRERQHIVDTLAAMGVDTADFIVSNGRAYIGNQECEDYIQGTHAWCSSSMSC